ncbi:GTP-binding protein [Candidatus Vidania fulgoroideorum]
MKKIYPIIAISTCNLCDSGIGIIRISLGNKEIIYNTLIKKLFKKKYLFPRLATYSKIYLNNKFVDYGVILYFPSPNSFNGETIIEIQMHGNIEIMNNLLNFCIYKFKFKKATKGEFTKRALMNKKIDIFDLKIIYNIINYKKNNEILNLNFRKDFILLNNIIFNSIIYIENLINFDMEKKDIKIKKITKNIMIKIKNVEKKINFFNINSNVKVAIVGLPNVGKSSIFNKILGYKRSIVSNTKGTTRNYLEDTILINNKKIIIYDTAGITNTSDKIEINSIKQTKNVIKFCDIIILVINELDNKNKNLFIKKYLKKKIIILVINKIDKIKKKKKFSDNLIKISCKKNIGTNNILKKVFYYYNNIIEKKNKIIFETKKIKKYIFLLKKNIKLFLNSKIYLDFLLNEIKFAQKKINKILNIRNKSIIKKIFKTFCIGK